MNSNKGRKLPPEPLTPDEVERLSSAANPRYPTGARNRAIIMILATSGLRISEALDLRPKDYDRTRGTVRVLRGKGRKHRLVPVMGATATAIERWMVHRGALELPAGAPLFCTLGGGKVATAYMRRLLPRLAKRAGIGKRVHPHGLRHTFATESMRRGVRLNSLSRVLGHASTAITSRYIDHLGADQAVDDVRAAWADEE